MARLDGRPLLGTFDDRDLFVEPAPMARLRGAVGRGLNVAVLGQPGSGKTSLLRILVSDLVSDGRQAVYIDLSPSVSAGQALMLIADALGQRDALRSWGDALRTGLVPGAVESEQLLRLVRRLGDAEPTIICADSPPGEGAAHMLFGRLRDELWQLPHQWVVAADTALRDELAKPPASAFFEVTVELEALDADRQLELLARRVADDPDLAGLPGQLVERSDGRPRALLDLAREAALVGGDVQAVFDAQNAWQARAAALSTGAQAVAKYLRSSGPTSASDRPLLATLGVSAQRARQLLGQLEAAGLVRSYSEQAERRGRPRKLYEIVADTEYADDAHA